jgi:purine-nucleoside phosphorylase
MCEKVKVRDIVIAQGACTNSRYSHTFNLPGDFAPISDFTILRTLVETAEKLNLKHEVGNVLSSDVSYGDNPEESANWQKMGVLAVEMEAAALFMNAARANKRAGALFTVSDHLITGEALPAIERQNSFTDMMKLALETAVQLENK